MMDHVFFQLRLLVPLVHLIRKKSCIHGESVQTNCTIVELCPCPCRNTAAVFLQKQTL